MRRRVILALAALLLLSAGCSKNVKRYGVDVVAEYPHDTTMYTQGLFWQDGRLYESAGLYGSSSFAEVNLTDGTPVRKMNFDDEYFMEGSVMLNGKLYILTWTNRVAFIYGADSLDFIKGCKYYREGWGLTTDGKSLIASDGSDNLYWLDENLKLQKTVTVTRSGRGVRLLNELEWIDGRIWANVYTTDEIVIINPGNGEVEGVVDCRGLLPRSLRSRDTDVLNGIAYNPSDGKIYLTGKLWPRLYEIKLKERK